MTARAFLTTAAAMLLFGAATACDQSKPAPASDHPSSHGTTGKSADLAGGTKHDPPIEPAQVPDGHWYCDMGTVHYSRPDKGDGKCPLCGMALKHKGSAE